MVGFAIWPWASGFIIDSALVGAAPYFSGYQSFCWLQASAMRLGNVLNRYAAGTKRTSSDCCLR